jgi:hypothetical protein
VSLTPFPLSPTCFSLLSNNSVAYERDFTIIPICAAHDHARGLPVGYLDIEALTMRMKLNNYEFEEMQLSLGELMEREGGGGGGGGKEVKRFDLKSNYQGLVLSFLSIPSLTESVGLEAIIELMRFEDCSDHS